jgi:hypothetical protein
VDQQQVVGDQGFDLRKCDEWQWMIARMFSKSDVDGMDRTDEKVLYLGCNISDIRFSYSSFLGIEGRVVTTVLLKRSIYWPPSLNRSSHTGFNFKNMLNGHLHW